ncbi:hypothetical protein LWI28_018798 [Acer negundo]|uniref:Uncharacterized protein n=1 Tax=Acer negundo TaxID=4023 RepID=A0AAD5INN5_ACENE|nr:hypothetical protein LWI28_018798 [Acer negundo]
MMWVGFDLVLGWIQPRKVPVPPSGEMQSRRKQNKKPSLGFWSWKEKKKKSTLLCLSFYNESETCGGFLYLSPVLPVGTSSVQVHIN